MTDVPVADESSSESRDPVDRLATDTLRSEIEDSVPWTGHLLQLGGDADTTRWLARQGHEVVRVVPNETEAAEYRAVLADGDATASESVSVVVADPSDLPQSDDSLDGACWLGDGLSALASESERIDAVAELERVVAPSGKLFLAGIGRFGAIRTELARAPEAVSQSFAALAGDGAFTRDRVGAGDRPDSLPELPYHGFRLDHFEREVVESGAVVDRVLGLDGFLAGLDNLDGLSGSALQRIGAATDRVNTERSVADGAFRLLAVGRVTEDTAAAHDR